MEYQNITLSLPKELLKKVKHLAIDRNTSVSGLLSQTLQELVDRETGYRKACERQLQVMEKGFDLGLYGQPSWTREETHER